ncbi:unnamed protein product [Sympodiomycopsis kandeliae]
MQCTYKIGNELFPEWYDVKALANVLRQSEYVSRAVPIANAHVPFVRLELVDGQGSKSVDVIVNNVISWDNSELIRAYTECRPKTLPPLYFAVRYWLRNRKLNDSSAQDTGKRSLSTYAIALLVIQFLQQYRNLPNLQQPALVAQIHSDSNRVIPEGREVRKPTYNDRTPSHGVTDWNANFADAREMDLVYDIKSNDGWTAIVPRGFFKQHREPPSYQSWLTNYNSMKGQAIWSHLPHPDDAGFYRSEPQNDDEISEEVGRLFISFTYWFRNLLHKRTLIDVSHGQSKKLNSSALERQYKQYLVNQARGERPTYDVHQPLEWSNEKFVVADPFLKHRNVIRNCTDETMNILRYESRRACASFNRRGPGVRFVLIARPADFE